MGFTMVMSDWRTCRVPPDATIEETMQCIQDSALRIAVVTTGEDRLLGVVTDGDIRRGILDGLTKEVSVTEIMSEDPVTAQQQDDRNVIIQLMRDHRIHQVPVVDSRERVVRLEIIEDALFPERRPNPVVVMAGGLGTRLRPITEECPKPLVEVGGVPILQTILERLSAQGFRDVYLSVNYKADMIEEHFGEGDDLGLRIEYLREQERRGTAGALSLLPDRPEHPILVLNGDLLTTLNFGRLIDYHRDESVVATMCVRSQDVDIPYGVIETEDRRVADIEEKPTDRYFVNAGIYVLEPGVLNCVPADQFYDMTELFQHLVDRSDEVTAYPIQEYWRDVGQKEDLYEAKEEYHHVFQ